MCADGYRQTVCLAQAPSDEPLSSELLIRRLPECGLIRGLSYSEEADQLAVICETPAAGVEARMFNHDARLVSTVKLPDQTKWCHPLSSERFLLLCPRQRPAAAEPGPNGVRVLEQTPSFTEGEGFVSGRVFGLMLYEARRQSKQWLTAADFDVETVTFSERLGRGACIGRSGSVVQSVANSGVYFVLPPSDEAPCVGSVQTGEIPAQTEFLYTDLRWVSRDCLLYSGSDMQSEGINQFEDLFLYNVRQGTQRRLSPQAWQLSLWNSVRSDVKWGPLTTRQACGSHYYFCGTEQGKTAVYRLNWANEGQSEPEVVLDPEQETVDGFAVAKDGIWFVGQSADTPQEINYRWGDNRRLSSRFHEKFSLGLRCRPFADHHRDILWLPATAAGQATVPLVVMLHGGPRLCYGEAFLTDRLALLHRNMAVLLLNPPGSDGFGRAYADIRGKYGLRDAEYVLNALAKTLKNHSCLNSAAVGIWGGSYGGFLSAWLCGHSNAFAAACIERPIINWQSFYLTSDIGWFFARDQLGADLSVRPDLYAERSPLSYVSDWRTPTLIIQGSDDRRCPESESRQLLTALHLQGVPAVLRLYERADHDLSVTGHPQQKKDRQAAIINWFAKYLSEGE